MPLELNLVCPQCQSKLTEILDSYGGAFVCTSDFHGKIAKQFSREDLEIAQGIVKVEAEPIMPEGACLICSKPIINKSGYCQNCDSI